MKRCGIGGIDRFKRQLVGAQAVVVDVGEGVARSGLVKKLHATLLQQGNLIRYG